MTANPVVTGDLVQPLNDGDDLPVQVWWIQSWGCPALHYEEQMPPVIGCDFDWYRAFPEDRR